MRFFRRSLVGLFLLALTAGLFAIGGKITYDALQTRWSEEARQRPARERVFAVNVLPIAPETIAPVLTSFGEVRATRTLDLRAPTSGRVIELAPEVVEGGLVEKGQLLGRLDPSDAQTALFTAQTDLVEANADLGEAERGLLLAQDELAAAKNQEDLRAKALARQRDLLSRGVGTEAAVETAELSLSSASQAVLSRRQAVQQAEARITQINTLIDRRKQAVNDAKRLLAETEVRASFSGRLADINISVGALVSPNEQFGTLIDLSEMEVSFRVSTAQYARLLGDDGTLLNRPVTIVLDVFGTDLEIEGRLVRESAAVSGGTTGRVLFAALSDPKGLRPGDFVTVQVEEPELNRVARVPASSVDATGSVLVLGEEDRLEEAQVAVLRKQGDDVLIRARELVGREIVAERSQLLGAGIKVRPLRQGDATVPEAPEMVELDEDRRARLIAFVEKNNRMPDEVRQRLLTRLAEPKVPAEMVQRLESRMGS